MCWVALGPESLERRSQKSVLGLLEPRQKGARAVTRHGAGVMGLRGANDHSSMKGHKCQGQGLGVIVK